MSQPLQLEQIQGIVVSGYGDRPSASYALIEIVDRVRVQRWLGTLIPMLQFAEYRATPRDQAPSLHPLCVNIAFTHEGFRALGLGQETLLGFSHAFQEGAAEPSRARRLGDDGDSDPRNWVWGKPEQKVHGILAVFAGAQDAASIDDTEIRAFIDGQLISDNGVRLVHFLPTTPSHREFRKEHFGFRDGIANPSLASLARGNKGAADTVADGEFILGYTNAYGRFPISPEVPVRADPAGLLPSSTARAGHNDFGKNGSYLVFRQLRQDVQRFWQYVHEAKDNVPDAPAGQPGSEWLAARLVGRWRNGTPVTLFPDAPGPDERADDDQFLYHQNNDDHGTKCPIGSHLRRTNPRDTALPVPHDPELSGFAGDAKTRREQLEFVRKHRLLRRGRLYGPPLDPGYDPEVMRQPTSGFDHERGLYFLCMNANISRQFEFVQSNWAANPTFAGLSRDPDPLISADRACPFRATDFTLQGTPPRRIHGLPRVVETRGAAYFFMPSRQALQYLASIK